MIKKLPNKKYRVTGKDGKGSFGTYPTHAEALKRLRQMEYYKNHKKK